MKHTLYLLTLKIYSPYNSKSEKVPTLESRAGKIARKNQKKYYISEANDCDECPREKCYLKELESRVKERVIDIYVEMFQQEKYQPCNLYFSSHKSISPASELFIVKNIQTKTFVNRRPRFRLYFPLFVRRLGKCNKIVAIRLGNLRRGKYSL